MLGNIPYDESAEYQKIIIEKEWNKRTDKGENAFVRTLVSWYKWKLLLIFFMNFILAVMDGVQPYLLKEIIIYLEEKDTTNKDLAVTLTIAVAMIVNIFVNRVFREYRLTYEIKLALQSKQAISAMIFSKILKVSPSTNKKFKKGELINMTTNDAGRMFFIFETLTNVSRLPFIMLFLMILLYIFIGWVFSVAIVVIIIFCLVNYFLARWSAAIQKVRLTTMDERIHKISEVVDNIKVIKFNWLIDKFDRIVNAARDKEIVVIVKKLLVYLINLSFYHISYPVLGISIFTIAILGAKISITIPTALAIITILNSMDLAARSLPNFIGNYIEFIVSMNRIQNFLLWEEADLSIIEKSTDHEVALKIDKSSYWWGLDKNANKLISSTPSKQEADIESNSYVCF